MIKTLCIKDFILIDELEIAFDKGFNVITGETGAGKSIIINAIDLAFGARASKEVIKTGKTRAIIELTLKTEKDFSKELFEEQGIEMMGEELVISREITESGSRSRINGVMVSQDVMKQIREQLIDIHSQHMTYTYIQPRHHIRLLDNYGGNEHLATLNSYKEIYTRCNNVLKRLEEAKNKTELSEQQVEFLKFQINEIEDAHIEDISEDEQLENELQVLANAEKLKEYTYSSYWSLYGDDAGIVPVLGKIKTNISKAGEFDTNLSEIESELINCQEILRDISSRLRDYADNMELDEARLNGIQERLDTLEKIKRKYGNTLEKVLETYDGFVKELNAVEFSEDEIQRLEAEKSALLREMTAISEKLTISRKNIAAELGEILSAELEKLDMPKVRFEIDVKPCDFNANGANNVEFLISTNISEAPRPLAKIASGGEISRVMLAIKTIFAHTDNINTIIFDEIDTGISGKACQAVAEEIAALAKSHQIISITHQPIIAAKSDRHFYVSKSQEDRTRVKVYTLDEENRVKAIAMLAAGDITEDSLKFARQLINA